MLKQELREIYKSKRKLLTNNEIENLSLDLANKTLDLDIWNYNNYHVFFPIEKNQEVDTKLIIQIIQGKDKNVILPKIDFKNKELKSYLLTDSTLLKTNKLGVSEPHTGIEMSNMDLEIVFVPLLCFDNYGNRVGYGGGYYDKLLSECSKETLKIGLSFFKPVKKITDISKNDARMDYCICPSKVYEF